LKRAGEAFREERYFSSGEQLEQIKRDYAGLAADPPVDQVAELRSLYRAIVRAQQALEFEGVTLTPLLDLPEPALPEVDEAVSESDDQPSANMPSKSKDRRQRDQRKRDKSADNADEMESSGISFSRNIAPLLLNYCGGCHVDEAKGDFSAATYTALMRGVPNVGTVVFANDSMNSRLIEVIVSGDMPRGGGSLAPQELDMLRQWIDQGAKFDGRDPEQSLRGVVESAARSMDLSPKIAERQRRASPPMAEDSEITFAKHVAPILIENCTGCHLNANQVRGQLRMDTVAQLFNGGVSGQVIQPGKSRESLLIKKLRGEMGDRMPIGRPALSDEQIGLIARWIDSGAPVNESEQRVPLERLATLAWVDGATADELSERRHELAIEHWQLVSPQNEATEIVEGNFVVFGDLPPAQLQNVAKAAVAAQRQAEAAIRFGSAGPSNLLKAKTTIFVFNKRYDYAEFGRMIEGRDLPSDWQGHWQEDGIDAYVVLILDAEEEEDQLQQRLLHQLAALRVALAGEAPRWLSEGLGRALLARGAGRQGRNAAWDDELPSALAGLDKPETLLEGRLSASRADLIGYGIGKFLLDKSQRRQLDALLEGLAKGANLNQACRQQLGVPPAALVSSAVRWLVTQSAR
jgi:mono/diheme cytochrome c family protein